LRDALAERLPPAMIPGAFVVIDALPLTPNGKIDRKALAAMEQPAEAEPEDREGPRTPVQEGMAAIWADVLGRPDVGIRERFADLGGHSLLAIQIIARAREAFQVELPLRAIFEAPTIAELCERVEEAMRAGDAPIAPAIVRAPRDGELPLSFSQE